jgi:hypothetical protein
VRRALATATLAAMMLLASSGASATTIISHPDFSDVSDLNLNGSATTAGVDLVLTDTTGQAGSAFTNDPVIDPAKSFHASFTFNFPAGPSNDYPADGFTFTVQNDGRGSDAVGDAGGELGYGGSAEITPSIAIGFTTGFPTGPGAVKIMENGSNVIANNTKFVMCGCSGDPATYSGQKRYAWVDYSSSSLVLKVFVSKKKTKPDKPFIKADIGDLSAILGSSAYAGFTGGTGGSWVEQHIIKWKVTQ